MMASSPSPFRLRWNINLSGAGQAISTSGATGLVLKLQYAEMVGGSCTATGTSGTWADVTGSTPIQFYTGNTNATNAAPLIPDANDPTDGSNTALYQTFSNANNFSNTQYPIYPGQDGLWDFALAVQANPFHTSYCLRAFFVNGGSGAITSNSTYPQINIGSTMDQLMRGSEWWNSSGIREYKQLH
jgi:hypothetical protein